MYIDLGTDVQRMLMDRMNTLAGKGIKLLERVLTEANDKTHIMMGLNVCQTGFPRAGVCSGSLLFGTDRSAIYQRRQTLLRDMSNMWLTK